MYKMLRKLERHFRGVKISNEELRNAKNDWIEELIDGGK